LGRRYVEDAPVRRHPNRRQRERPAARIIRFEGTPAPGPRVLTDDKVANTQDIAQPGEIRFVFTTALTGAEGTALDTALTNHDSTDRLNRQARIDTDLTDLDTLESQWPSFDSFTDAQFKAFVKRLARFTIRRARQSAAF
jgi:hypothetical protein